MNALSYAAPPHICRALPPALNNYPGYATNRIVFTGLYLNPGEVVRIRHKNNPLDLNGVQLKLNFNLDIGTEVLVDLFTWEGLPTFRRHLILYQRSSWLRVLTVEFSTSKSPMASCRPEENLWNLLSKEPTREFTGTKTFILMPISRELRKSMPLCLSLRLKGWTWSDQPKEFLASWTFR